MFGDWAVRARGKQGIQEPPEGKRKHPKEVNFSCRLISEDPIFQLNKQNKTRGRGKERGLREM